VKRVADNFTARWLDNKRQPRKPCRGTGGREVHPHRKNKFRSVTPLPLKSRYLMEKKVATSLGHNPPLECAQSREADVRDKGGVKEHWGL